MSTKDSKSTKKPTEEALTTPVDAEQSAHQNSEEKLAKEQRKPRNPRKHWGKEHFAKAGKRSKKHIEAEKAEAARQARKVETKGRWGRSWKETLKVPYLSLVPDSNAVQKIPSRP